MNFWNQNFECRQQEELGLEYLGFTQNWTPKFKFVCLFYSPVL